MDVIVCLEGQNILKNCLLGLDNCSDSNPCRLHSFYKEFRKDLERILMKESLEELVKDTSHTKNIVD